VSQVIEKPGNFRVVFLLDDAELGSAALQVTP
jgi:hypothetical protein